MLGAEWSKLQPEKQGGDGLGPLTDLPSLTQTSILHHLPSRNRCGRPFVLPEGLTTR